MERAKLRNSATTWTSSLQVEPSTRRLVTETRDLIVGAFRPGTLVSLPDAGVRDVCSVESRWQDRRMAGPVLWFPPLNVSFKLAKLLDLLSPAADD